MVIAEPDSAGGVIAQKWFAYAMLAERILLILDIDESLVHAVAKRIRRSYHLFALRQAIHPILRQCLLPNASSTYLPYDRVDAVGVSAKLADFFDESIAAI